ncbi:hypothetical protein I316_02995 [Kwoniella heveanensis BCC8398]|uniref:Rgp1-domain-containing protein n=1 Tax=Kwoniella heveanensis BCC8398 TaxID=1296120 RepID=A0A1B9GWN8_9TREE|nr:hypothetical protein I316_02995 [Kwoniella heveanensis BCC8398]
MSSYFPFSSSTSSAAAASTSTAHLDDPHLQVTVTPSASAYYAGETFSVTITFTNTRTPPIDASIPKTPGSVPPTADVRSAISATRQLPALDHRDAASSLDLPKRKNQIGRNLPFIPLYEGDTNGNADAGPSRLTTPLSINSTPGQRTTDPGHLYSPGANTSFRASGWPTSAATGPSSPTREGPMNFRSPDGWGRTENGGADIQQGNGRETGHTRRARSLALGKGTMSPQELVWALSGQPTPPPLPSRRPQSGTAIPAHHPHSRKISVTNFPISPPSNESLDILSPPLKSVNERYPSIASEAGPSRPTSRPKLSRAPSSTSTQATTTTTDDDAFISNDALTRSKSRPGPPSPLAHTRTPSYYNAYGASFLGLNTPPPLPPPTHPYIRERFPSDRGTTNILWAYTRLVAHFHPSNAHIPPDPLLPLRAQLLHQPVGSGSLSPSPAQAGVAPGQSSRWQLSFGTGTIGNSTQPSLTGSLFGLAKDLVMGGSGGTLEEERKRVWNMKDLPVLETTRSLLGVDLKLKEGESKEFTYTLQLPTTLPPTHRGKAFRFTYDLVVSLNVGLPGGGGRQKSKDVTIPIRVWANVSVGNPLRTYDVLHPIIQTREEGVVQEVESEPQESTTSLTATVARAGGTDLRRRSSASDRLRLKNGDTQESLQAYARHLLETLEPPSLLNGGDVASPRQPPLSPSGGSTRLPRSRVVSPSSPAFNIPPLLKANGDNSHTRFVEGDDELVEEGHTGCGEAVEILSRHSPKASYDIAKEGEIVAVLTLIKTTYRLGETVLGVVTFNEPDTERRVLKFSAFLESHELIPQPLLPPPGNHQPPLTRLHAEHRSSYVVSSSRLAFSLDIPSDATPAFSLAAGEGDKGGLEWKVKLQFVVAVPPAHSVAHDTTHRRKGSSNFTRGGQSDEKQQQQQRQRQRQQSSSTAVSLLPSPRSGIDHDHRFYSASTTLAPLVPVTGSATATHNGSNTDYTDAKQAVARLDVVGGGAGGTTRWVEMKTELVECEVPVKVLAGNTAFVVRPSVWVI